MIRAKVNTTAIIMNISTGFNFMAGSPLCASFSVEKKAPIEKAHINRWGQGEKGKETPSQLQL
jgi:hypothetical protein